MSSTNSGIVLLSTEVELYVQALQTFPIEEIGSNKWSSQHEMIEKLNMQAIISANSNETEYVKDSLLTYEKMPVLLHELIAVELWKEKIFSQLFKLSDFQPNNTFVIYLIVICDKLFETDILLLLQTDLYHEATLVNLLETVLYHSEICQALGDTIFDLIDYCYRKMTQQIRVFADEKNKTDKHLEESETKMNEAMKELLEQSNKMQFDILMKLFSILRYIIDNISNLPLGVTNRILNKHDFILLLVQAMELQMWCKTDKNGKFFKYIDNKWKLIPLSERFQLTKTEGQVWISLYELLLNPNCISKYDYTDYKKNQILKLRSHLNEVVIDQIPNLGVLQRFLEQLAVTEPPAYKSELVIEQIAEFYDSMITKHKGKWKEITRHQAQSVLSPNENEIKNKAKRWADTFSTEALEQLIDEPAKCPECGQPAPKRCSRCQSEWYCRRECQVKHWPKHKKACDMIVKANEDALAAPIKSSF